MKQKKKKKIVFIVFCVLFQVRLIIKTTYQQPPYVFRQSFFTFPLPKPLFCFSEGGSE